MFVTDSGTAIPIANTLDVLGGHIAAAGTPIHTTGSTNVVTINIQASSAQAVSSAVNMGGASFNSSQFTVDANGFVSMTSGVFTWNNVTTPTQLIAVENGYVTNNAGGVTYTLPATASFGDEFKITGKSGLWVLAQNANQQVDLAASSTTVGVTGSLTATSVGDSISCVCITGGASTVWRAYNSVGNILIQ